MSRDLSEETNSPHVYKEKHLKERELIEAAQTGDKKAYGKLIMIHQRRLLRTILMITGRRDSALDIVQDAFVKAWGALGNFESGRPFYPWIATIARNLALNYIKRHRREQSLEEIAPLAENIPDESGSPLDKLIGGEADKRFAAALLALPEQFRAVFVLRMYDKLSYEQIAKELGISPGTVDSRLYRAREKLLELLKDELK